MSKEYSVPNHYKKHIYKIVTWLWKEFNLHDYEIILKWVEKLGDYEEDSKRLIAAEIDIDSRYYVATITFSDGAYQYYIQKRFGDLFELIVHEMCHILTEPIVKVAERGVPKAADDMLDEVKEQVTQKLTNIIRVHYKKWQYTPPEKKKKRRR